MQLLTPKEAQDLWPLMDISDVVGAAFLPTDGQASPSDITQALARGARTSGAKIIENCAVTEIITENENLVGVKTKLGSISCEKLVLCCGQWTRDLAATVGVNVPLVSVEHQYMITENLVFHRTYQPLGTLTDLHIIKRRLGDWFGEVMNQMGYLGPLTVFQNLLISNY